MGAQYEGLVVLFNSLVASAGGHVVSDDGKKAIMDAGAIKGLQELKAFATAGVTNASFSNMIEDDVRHAFQNNEGAFELNWPYVYASMQSENPELAKSFAWTRYPAIDAGTPSVTTIGGSNLAVSAYSKHPAEALQAVQCLRGSAAQKYLAINAGQPPSIEAVYNDPDMAKAYPMKDELLDEMASLVDAKPPLRVPPQVVKIAAPYGYTAMTTSMRVSNDRARNELGWAPAVVDYRQGLRMIASE